MLTTEDLAAVLHAVATGYPDRALNIVAMSTDISEEERTALWHVLDRGPAGEEMLRALGDVLRGLSADPTHVNECYRAAFYAGGGPERMSSNPLFAYFSAKKGGLVIDKWPHYFPVYERHLAPWRGTDVRLLEVGTFRGGGLDMLRAYLGPAARLVGADIDPIAVEVARERHVVELGDQTDAAFLQKVVERHGPFDIVIDDGGHTMEQQIATAVALLPAMAEGGVYIVEDTHTSYWSEFGGALREPGTFLEWAKDRVDDLHAHHWSLDTPASRYSDLISGMHIYDSVVVFDVGRRHAPFAELAGTWDFLKLARPMQLVHSELVATRDVALHAVAQANAEAERAAAEALERQDEATRARADLEAAWDQLRALRGSTSWRLTAPLRRLRRRKL